MRIHGSIRLNKKLHHAAVLSNVEASKSKHGMICSVRKQFNFYFT